MNTERHFYRCQDCLEVWTADIEAPAPRRLHGYTYPGIAPLPAECPFCTCADIKDLGAVRGTHLHTTDLVVPCDARCTHAMGPNCDCPCMGENHGTKWLMVVDRTGPSLKCVATEAQKSKAAETRTKRQAELNDVVALCAPRLAEHAAIVEEKGRGWMEPERFARYCAMNRWKRAYDKARALQTHAGRMKALRRAAEVEVA